MDIKPETSKNVLTYTLYVAGIFGRNRKAKNGMFKLAEIPAGVKIGDDDLRKMVDQELVAQKVKSGARWNVVEQGETINTREIDGRTFQSRSFMLFTGTKRLEGTVA